MDPFEATAFDARTRPFHVPGQIARVRLSSFRHLLTTGIVHAPAFLLKMSFEARPLHCVLYLSRRRSK